MIPSKEPSLTAFTAAAARAAHLIVDHEPYIFADTLAGAMLGDRAEEFIGYHRAHGTHPILSCARAQVTCRSRYTEHALADAIQARALTQYVILGAGFDSFAYRADLATKVRVFEVDHPATQDWKRQHVAVLNWPGPPAAAPENLTFVPVDFTTDSLDGHLRKAGFDQNAPAFVSWLGVTMYLTASTISETLGTISGFAPGSEVVLDYMLPAGLRDEAGDAYVEAIAPVSAERGEPWLSTPSPDEVEAMLRQYGCHRVRHVNQHDLIPDALWTRTDSLRPADLSRIAHATIADHA